MSNEVNRWTILKVADDEFYLDDGVSPECEYSEIKVMLVADHDRIVAELKAQLEQSETKVDWLLRDNERVAKENDAEIAKQAKVIEKLREQRNIVLKAASQDEIDLGYGQPESWDKQLEAIERGDG